jgi:hypothetical protein
VARSGFRSQLPEECDGLWGATGDRRHRPSGRSLGRSVSGRVSV